MYLINYGFWKLSLDKFLKIRVSGDPLTNNMVNGIKECLYLNDTTFIMFIDHFEDN